MSLKLHSPSIAVVMLSLSKHPAFAEARFAEALSEAEGEVEGEAEGSTKYRADRSTLRDQDSSGPVWDTLRRTPQISRRRRRSAEFALLWFLVKGEVLPFSSVPGHLTLKLILANSISC